MPKLTLPPLLNYLDPGRSLACATGWLVLALSTGLALVASMWVDGIVRTNLLEQRQGQLESTASRMASELNLDVALQLQSVGVVAALLTTELRQENQATMRTLFDNLQRVSPEFEWVGAANLQGRVLAATNGVLEGVSVADQSWFALGLKPSKISGARPAPMVARTPPAATKGNTLPSVDLIASVIDAQGAAVGVIGARLSRRWLHDLAGRLMQEPGGSVAPDALLLDREGAVLIGPVSLEGQRWEITLESKDTAAPIAAVSVPNSIVGRVRVIRLADGRDYLVAQEVPRATDALHALGWRIVVLQPLDDAAQPATRLQRQITAILLGLGLIAALIGVLLARRITRDLDAIARSADAVRAGATQQIAVPIGRNEAARLGRALDELLTSQQREHNALLALNAELDQRVAARTREVERLAEQARYAAVVRERLKIARDLHDTLAHSMMAMLAEVRLLKRLATANPSAMADELARAEETAHQGLKEVRAAIAQMRFNPVRDVGLAAALDDFVGRFVERSGIPVDYVSDARAATFADERAETLFRIAEEAMHNVERHARATRVSISLRVSSDSHGLTLTIADDGVGFDAESAHPGHYGLTGLREQAHLAGAVLEIRSAPQLGTTISVWVANM